MLCLLISPCISGQNIRIGVLDEEFIEENSNIDKWIREEVKNFGDFSTDSIINIQKEIIQNYYKEIEKWNGRAHADYIVRKFMYEEIREVENHYWPLVHFADTTLVVYTTQLLNWKACKLQVAIDSVAKFLQYDMILPSDVLLHKTIALSEEMKPFSKEVLDILNNISYAEFQEFSIPKRVELHLKIQQKMRLPSYQLSFSDLYESNVFAIILLSLSYLKS